MKIIRGKVWRFGDDVNTDDIIAAQYLNITAPQELAKHCMEPIRPGFIDKIKQSDIIVAGKNFGCGSSREHAPIAIKGTGISSVVAISFARIFYRNSFNIGLPIFETSDAIKISEGDEVEIDYVKGKIRNITKGEVYSINPISEFMQKLVECGGLMEYAKKITNSQNTITK